MTPSLSVLMTVFNAGRYLEPAIRSILTQTFRDFEFVIVNDGSSDGSGSVLDEWARRDARVRVIHQSANVGQTVCLNEGLAAARGKWVARQDADDLSHPLRLARQFEAVTICPEIDLIGVNGRIVDGNDRLVGLLDVPLTSETIRWSMGVANPFIHTGVMFRAEAARRLGGYDPRFRIAQDYDLWVRMTEEGSAMNLSGRFVAYRHLGSSLSKTGRDLAFEEARRAAEVGGARVFPGRSFGAAWEAFRTGFPRGGLADFWRVVGEMRRVVPLGAPDAGRLFAAWHFRCAGAVGGVALAGEIFAAFRCAGWFSAGWLRERFLGGSRR